MSGPTIYRVAVAAPLPRLFDYLPAAEGPAPVGGRVRVPFGNRRPVGVVMQVAEGSALPEGRLKPIARVLDAEPVFDEAVLTLLRWAADYYRHPVGEVVAAALPRHLREGHPAAASRTGLRLSAAGAALEAADLARAPRQAELLALLRAHPEGVGQAGLRRSSRHLADAARRMLDAGLVETFEERDAPRGGFEGLETGTGPTLTPCQADALAQLEAADGFAAFLLFGVTGSGKTEVYLRRIARCVADGRQALVLVPEIALTPQLVRRFEARFGAPVVALHSGMAAGARLAGWRAAREGRAAIVIGTRSAVFTPLARPGLIVVDEEHDASLKQHEGFRYSARDLAVYRARLHDVPVLLGSATPTLESLHNVARGRYRRLDLPYRAGPGRAPHIRLVDLRSEPVTQGLSTAMNMAMTRHLDDGGQVMLFLNRRGFAPAWFCSGCGAVAACTRCDAHMTFHHRDHRLRCHHCGAERTPPDACEDCKEPMKPVGQGTERIEDILTRQFPDARVDRLDRDTTRRRGALEAVLGRMRRGETDILVGTQMLTKGHHFPDVSLVGIIYADQGLFSTDFRATERLAQTVVQVCGRAGRADRPGEVLIQTAFPEHPLLRCLVEEGYEAFTELAMAERRAAGWPPFSHLALIRARGPAEAAALDLLQRAARECGDRLPADVRVLGPASAPMVRRAGDYRAQLLLQARSRAPLNAALQAIAPALEAHARRAKVRWSIDVDPLDLF